MEHTELLLKVCFFRELAPLEIAKVANLVERQRYRTGQKVFQQGDASDSFYLIESGSVMVKGGAIVLATPGMGNTIGEMSFIDRGARSATVAAIEESELLRIPFPALDDLLDREPRMAARIYKAIALVLSSRLREMDQTLHTRFTPTKR